MDCATCREELSATLDGEDDPRLADATERHLAVCPDCVAWRSRAARTTRLVRTGPAEAGPDVDASVLDGVSLPRPATPWRVALAGVGGAQLLLGVLALLDTGAGHVGDPAMLGAGMVHMSHEAGAWNIALGAALLVGAARPRHLTGLLPALGVFLAVLTVLSALDLAAGRVDIPRVASHLVLVVGFLLGLVVSRRQPHDGSPEPGAARTGPPWARRRGGGAPPAPSVGPLGTAIRRRDAA